MYVRQAKNWYRLVAPTFDIGYLWFRKKLEAESAPPFILFLFQKFSLLLLLLGHRKSRSKLKLRLSRRRRSPQSHLLNIVYLALFPFSVFF